MHARLNRYIPLILLAGDLLVLLVFVLLGQADHDTLDQANPILGALPNVLALAAPWVVAGWLLGAFPNAIGSQEPSDPPPANWRKVAPSLGSFMARLLNTWLVAAPLGLVLRGLVLGRSTIPLLFLLVTMGLGGVFLLGWRLIFALAWRAIARR